MHFAKIDFGATCFAGPAETTKRALMPRLPQNTWRALIKQTVLAAGIRSICPRPDRLPCSLVIAARWLASKR